MIGSAKTSLSIGECAMMEISPRLLYPEKRELLKEKRVKVMMESVDSPLP